MGRTPDIKRIQKEDFEDKYQQLVDKLAFPINSFMEQVRSVLDKNVDFVNLNREIVNIDVTVDGNGTPVIETKYRSTLKTKVIGHNCINVLDLSETATFVDNTPFLTFSQNSNIVSILNVKGLPSGIKFRLIVECIGQ